MGGPVSSSARCSASIPALPPCGVSTRTCSAPKSVWLDRLRRRPARYAVWPTLEPAAAAALAESLRAEYVTYLDTLTADALDALVPYVNSAGLAFETPVQDILLQVFLHGQYHRGKINLMLRQSREEPIPTDYIAFARGVPAATTQVSTS